MRLMSSRLILLLSRKQMLDKDVYICYNGFIKCKKLM
jgi:hypothetical protein